MTDSNSDDRSLTDTDDPIPKTAEDVDSGTGVGDRDDPGRDRRDESTRIANVERRRKTSVVTLFIAAIGAWLAVSVLLYHTAAATLWNNVLVGAGVFVVAGANYYRITSDEPLSFSLTALVGLLGLWLLAAPPLLEMTGAAFWNTLASGLLVFGLASYTAYDARKARSIATEPDVESS